MTSEMYGLEDCGDLLAETEKQLAMCLPSLCLKVVTHLGLRVTHRGTSSRLIPGDPAQKKFCTSMLYEDAHLTIACLYCQEGHDSHKYSVCISLAVETGTDYMVLAGLELTP